MITRTIPVQCIGLGMYLLFAGLAFGQVNSSVHVGAITRDSGLYVGPSDLSDMKDVNKFLVFLESALAGEVANDGVVDYQDRSSTAELFHELHISSSSSFDSTSGATRGLLGRLDFLVVIDALDPSTAKMRLIDVESGSVRAVENCQKRFSLIGLSAQSPDCVPAMSRRIATAGRLKASAKLEKQIRFQKQQEAVLQARSDRGREVMQQRAATALVLAHQAELSRVQEDKLQLASNLEYQRKLEFDQRLRQSVLELKPKWDEERLLMSSVRVFWEGVQRQMLSKGQSLRPEITTLLNRGSEDENTGERAFVVSDVQTIISSTASLKSVLVQLDDYK